MILVTVTVDSLDRFLATFEAEGLALRERHGSRGVRVLQHADDPAKLGLLFDWDPDRFATFLADPDVQATMRAGGTLGPPAVQHLDLVRDLDA